jgi:antitoxin YefM
MTLEVSYSQARKQLASLLKEVTQDKEVVIITRRGGESAALISADELASLTETVHLLRSPANAERLLAALARAVRGEGNVMTLEELSAEAGLAE